MIGRGRLYTGLAYSLLIMSSLLLLSLSVSAVKAEEQSPTALSGDLSGSLKDTWAFYKSRFVQADGRVIDHQFGISTSEGQSYAMLRAVWMDDQPTFRSVYQWTRDNLQVRGDKLFAWKWGKTDGNHWGALDKTSASDADQDIALALILAETRWGNRQDLKDAQAILADIWEKETIETPMGRILLPGDWLEKTEIRQINPSYFAPYAYRIFDRVDSKHPWDQLVASSYQLLSRATDLTPTHLPPDWVSVSLKDGGVSLYPNVEDPRSDYGYEAFRVYWRVALDAWLVGKEPRAQAILEKAGFLRRYWLLHRDLPSPLTYDGIVRSPQLVSAAIYGGGIFALQPTSDLMKQCFEKRVQLYLQPGSSWNTLNDYYTQNWLWFGKALYLVSLTPAYASRDSRAKLMYWLDSVATFSN